MSINPATRYPANTTAPSAAYPLGSGKNSTTPGAKDGYPFEKDMIDDVLGHQQALLAKAGITESGNPDTAILSQYMQSSMQIHGLERVSVAAMVADISILEGMNLRLDDYAPGNNSGPLFFKIVAAATGTVDEGSYIDLPNTIPPTQAQQNFPDIISAKMFGAVGDGVADDSTAIQAALDKVRDDGFSLKFRAADTYKCDTGLTLLSNSITPKNYIIDFNGCNFDFTSLTGSEKAFRIGATSQANAHDKEIIIIKGGAVITGPESANPQDTQLSATSTSAQADTTTIGISFEFALNCNVKPLIIKRFYKGWTTNFCFPLITRGIISRENYIGAIIEEDSTRSHHTSPEFVECHYGLVVKPITDKIVTNQVFDSPRFEDVGVPVSIDPSDFTSSDLNGINGVTLNNPYFESCDFDHIRVGVAFDDTAAGRAVRGADRDRHVWGVNINPGFWSYVGPWVSGSGFSPIYSGTNRLVQGGFFSAPAEESQCINIPQTMEFLQLKDNFVSVVTSKVLSRKPGEGHVVFDGRNTGTGLALDENYGNISSVDRGSLGTYTINTITDYADVNAIQFSCVGNSAYSIWLTASTQNAINFEMRDSTGALVDVDKVRVTIGGALE